MGTDALARTDETTFAAGGTALSRRVILRRLGVGALAAAAAGLGLTEAEAKKKKKNKGPREGTPPGTPPGGEPGDLPAPAAARGRIGAMYLQSNYDYHNRRRVGVWTEYRRYYGNRWFYGYVRDFATGRDLLVWYYVYPTGAIYIYPLI